MFGSIDVFDRLAADLQQATISFRVTGKEAEIVRSYRDLSDRLSAELRVLGPDHLTFEAANKGRLGRALKRALQVEGRVRP